MRRSRITWSIRAVAATAVVMMTTGGTFLFAPMALGRTPSHHVMPRAVGAIDCNGLSPTQRSVKTTAVCADPRGGAEGRFEDNDHYVGHDEPIVRFLSKQGGSGNDITWTERLPNDPAAAPTTSTPGSDVTHWFELSVAPWFSMALCNPHSYPYTPCKPESDSNAPKSNFPWHTPHEAGGGSSLLEMQFYPPGFGPFVDNISCDGTHWCASLHINDLECNFSFAKCNQHCIEPTNFAFIQTDGVPTGPPGPQLANLATNTPNGKTLLMNPGDRIRAHIFDAALPGGGHALETRLTDLTTGQSGYMVASAANGFMTTRHTDCSGTPFNYRPEFDTARRQNSVGWTALQLNVATQFEIGHFTPCTSIAKPSTFRFDGFKDKYWNRCRGAYEKAGPPDGKPNPEAGDAPCYPVGDTHRGTTDPNLVTGCANFFLGNGDLDYDGTSYYPDWPDSITPDLWPSPFRQLQPRTAGDLYPRIQFETNAPASESTCHPSGKGCVVPPKGPGHFYPYWTQASVAGRCVWEFGQMGNGNSFGGTAQYGSPSPWYFGTLEGPIQRSPNC